MSIYRVDLRSRDALEASLAENNLHGFTWSYHVLPCLTMPYHVLPCLTMSYHVLPLTMSYLLVKTWPDHSKTTQCGTCRGKTGTVSNHQKSIENCSVTNWTTYRKGTALVLGGVEAKCALEPWATKFWLKITYHDPWADMVYNPHTIHFGKNLKTHEIRTDTPWLLQRSWKIEICLQAFPTK